MKLNKSKLVAIGISVVVASTAVGAANNYMSTDEPVEKPKTEKKVDKSKDKKTEKAKKKPAKREAEQKQETVDQQPLADYPKQEVKVFEPIVEETFKEVEAQPTEIPVEYVDTPPVEVPVINPYKIVLTEVTDYPNERYPDRVDQKCIHHMEDGTSSWTVSTVRIKNANLCLPSGTVMSKAQYIQFRTDEIPVQWRY